MDDTFGVEGAVERAESAADRAERAADRAERAARSGGSVVPSGMPNVNSVTCEACGHVGAPTPDGVCPNNNCPTRR